MGDIRIHLVCYRRQKLNLRMSNLTYVVQKRDPFTESRLHTITHTSLEQIDSINIRLLTAAVLMEQKGKKNKQTYKLHQIVLRTWKCHMNPSATWISIKSKTKSMFVKRRSRILLFRCWSFTSWFNCPVQDFSKQ